MKFFLPLLFLLVTEASFNTYAQEPPSFKDAYGNEFFISSEIVIPKYLTLDFLKEHLNGSYFLDDTQVDTYNYIFHISEIDKMNRENYRLRIFTIPQTDEIEEILKYGGGHSNYRLIIEKKKKVIKFECIEFM